MNLKVEPLKSAEGYRVYLEGLRNRMVINKLIAVLYKYGVKMGSKAIVVDLNNCKPPSYPNVILPLKGLIEIYRNEYKIDVSLEYTKGSYIDEVHIDNPYNLDDNYHEIKKSIFDKVIVFRSESDIESISSLLLKQLQESVVCKDGVIVGTSWCINEIMDNVLNHSGIEEGLIMCQVHNKNNHVAFSIYDYGKGLYNTLSNTAYNPVNSLEAIKLALQEGVTRDKKIGQGNGMWGLNNIVQANLGNLTIYTGNGMFSKDYREQQPYENEYESLNYPSRTYQMTLVEFSIDFDRNIDVNKALGDYEPFERIQMKIENSLTDDNFININVKQESTGTGTRRAGSKLRTYVNNIVILEKKKIQLNFQDVETISSSFADEFIGKLVTSFGFLEFSRLFKIINYNDYVKLLLDKAIKQRMSDTNGCF